MNRFSEIVSQKTTDELLKMVYEFDAWSPEMILAIEDELKNRGSFPSDFYEVKNKLIIEEENELKYGKNISKFARNWFWVLLFSLNEIAILLSLHYIFAKKPSKYLKKSFYKYSVSSRSFGKKMLIITLLFLFVRIMVARYYYYENESIEYYNKGIELHENQDYHGAIDAYTKAIELNPKNTEAYNNRGVSKDDIQDYMGAIADYTKAIELNPKNAAAYNNRSLAKYNIQDYNGAIADYTKAIELNPNNADAYNIRGLAKINIENYNGAIADCTKAIELNPKDAAAYNNRSLAKINIEDYNGAIADCTIAIELNPKLANAYCLRGLIKIELDDKKGACIDFQKSKELGFEDADDYINEHCK